MDLKIFDNCNSNSPLDITPYITAQKPETLESEKTFWITPQIMFKSFFQHEFECYSEVFNKLLMPKMGLHNSADYRIVNFNNKIGVITENLAGENEAFFTAFDIMNYYKYFNFTCSVIDELIRRFCIDKGFIYNDGIQSELEKLYLYDLLTMQQDRAPLNFGIVVDQDNQVRLVYYDHGNMLFMSEADLIEDFENGAYSIVEFDNNESATRLLINPWDSKLWHQPKLEFIRSYLDSADEEQLSLFQEMIDKYNDETVEVVFHEIEDENGVLVPPLFKRAIFEEVKYIQQGVHSLNLNHPQKSKKLT